MIPRIVGTKCPQFKKIVEIRANAFHSMAVSYDVLPSASSEKSETQGGILLTFGQDRMGVLTIHSGTWTGKERSQYRRNSSPGVIIFEGFHKTNFQERDCSNLKTAKGGHPAAVYQEQERAAGTSVAVIYAAKPG
jgi:hypothetical protein